MHPTKNFLQNLDEAKMYRKQCSKGKGNIIFLVEVTSEQHQEQSVVKRNFKHKKLQGILFRLVLCLNDFLMNISFTSQISGL